MDNPNLLFALEFLERTRRHWWVWFAIGGLGLSLALGAMRLLPKMYEAQTTILVAPPSFPEEYIRTQRTEDMAMRIASLREAVLSRPYLVRIGKDLYDHEPDTIEFEELLARLRKRLHVSIEHFDERRGTGLFALSYRSSDPEKAAAVVNALADSYIEANVRLRLSDAEQTTGTLSDLAQEVLDQIQEKETAIAAFKARNLYQLETHLQANLELLRTRQAEFEELTRSLQAAESRREILELQRGALASAEGGVSSLSAQRAERQSSLNRLREELAALLSRYNEEHPAVRTKRAEIKNLSGVNDALSQEGLEGALEMEGVKQEIDQTDRQITRLRAEQARCREDIDLYRSRIEATPEVEQRLAELRKGYDVLLQKYEEYQGNLEHARATQRLEMQRQGEQFEVLERAVTPSIPTRPRRTFVLAGSVGSVAGVLLLSFALPMLISPRVESRARLSFLVDLPVLASVGHVSSRESRRARFRFMALNFSLAMLFLVILLATMWWFR